MGRFEFRFDSPEAKVDVPGGRLNRLETKVDALGSLLSSVETKVGAPDGRLATLEEKVDLRLRETRPIWEGVLARLTAIEAESPRPGGIESEPARMNRQFRSFVADVFQLRARVEKLEEDNDKRTVCAVARRDARLVGVSAELTRSSVMYLFLLKKALPFTLTFVVGAAVSGLAGLFGPGEKKAETAVVSHTLETRACRMGRHKLVAETKPLAIHHVPEARWPLGAVRGGEGMLSSASVRVTFGADGRVHEVSPLAGRFQVRDQSLVELKANWEAVERAARRIRFTPELVNSVPVSVKRDVEIHFTRGD